MDDILSQIIAYAPDKIDTELKAAALVQGSRNMDQEPRNMYAQGQLVSNTVDGSRPGYNGKNAMSGSPAQQLGNLKKTQERFKKIGDAFISQNYNALKTQTRKARIATGAKDAGGILNQFDTKLLNDVVFSNDVKAQNALAKNLGTNRKYMMDTWKEALEVTKTGKSKSISQNQLKKIQMQANIFDEILSNKNATVKSMSKKFNITEKQTVKESSKLLNNVYMQNVAIGKKGAVNVDSRGYSLLKSWLPDDFKVTDNFLDNFSNIEGLKKVQSENMGTLIRDAFGRGQNPKKYAQALAGLQEYNKFVNSLPKGLKLDLDHPLSKAFLKGSNVSPDQLLNVTPISSNYNRGFKQSLSMAYDKALLADKKDPIKIKQIEKLAKNLGINIGKASNKKLNFGATNIAKKTQTGLAEELFKNLNEQNISSAKLNDLKKTEEGRKLLKEVFPTGRKLEIPQVEKDMLKFAATITDQCSIGNAEGGRIGFNLGANAKTNCLKIAKQGMENGLKNGFKQGQGDLARKILGSGKFLKDAVSLRGLFGPAALAFTALTEAGFVASDAISDGKSFREAIGDSAFNYMLGDKTKIDSEEEFIKRLKNIPGSPSQGFRGVTDEDIGKMQYFKESLKDMGVGFKNYNAIKDIEAKQQAEKEGTNKDLFSENSFQLEADKNILQADNQDYFRTNTANRVSNYLMSDAASEGAEALQKSNLMAKQDQLNNAYRSSLKGIESLKKEKEDIRGDLYRINNPTEYNEFAKYFMSKPKQEQSMIMGLGYNEGGIASLNVKK